MTDQRALRRRIAALEGLQARRIQRMEQMKSDMDAILEKAQRELDNLKAQVTIK